MAMLNPFARIQSYLRFTSSPGNLIQFGNDYFPDSRSRGNIVRIVSCRLSIHRSQYELSPPHILGNNIESFLAGHIDCGDNKVARNPGEDGRIHHAQTFCASHAKPAVEYRHGIVIGANLVGTRGMMTPGFVLNESAEFLTCLYLRTRHLLIADYLLQRAVHLAHKLHALDHRIQVLTRGIIPLGKIMKFNTRRISWISRPQADTSRRIVGMRL